MNSRDDAGSLDILCNVITNELKCRLHKMDFLHGVIAGSYLEYYRNRI